ncbi:MAG: TonB family protein, partial [Enterobacteriaceae bacterium]
ALLLYISFHNKAPLAAGSTADSGVIMLDTRFLSSAEMAQLSDRLRQSKQSEPEAPAPTAEPEPVAILPPEPPVEVVTKTVVNKVTPPEKKVTEKKKPPAQQSSRLASAAKSAVTASDSTAPVANSTQGTTHQEGAAPTSALTAGKTTNSQPEGRVAKELQRVQPLYPQRARVLGIEGEVKVQFDVDGSGQIDNIRIMTPQADPLFIREVRKVMRRWRYESLASKNLLVTIEFKINGDVQMR